MATLNLESFNEILFGALKDTSTQGKIDMIRAELEMVANVFMEACGEVLDELEQNGYKSEKFDKVMNIKNNTEHLLEQLEELENQLKEEQGGRKVNEGKHC